MTTPKVRDVAAFNVFLFFFEEAGAGVGRGRYYVTNLSDNMNYIQRVFAIEGHKYNFYIFSREFSKQREYFVIRKAFYWAMTFYEH